MKKLQEKVKVLMNSTYSSLVDYGLTNSQFADLSSVSEDEAEENKGTQYQNLGVVRDGQDYEGMRAPGTARTGGKQHERRTIMVEKKATEQQHAKSRKRHREPLASPFELAPKAARDEEEDAEPSQPDVLLLNNQDDPISNAVQHYFIDKKHQSNSKKAEKKNAAAAFNMFEPIDAEQKHDRHSLPPAAATSAEKKNNESKTPPPQRAPKKHRVNFRSPVDRSPLRNADKSYISDQRSQDSNLTMIQIQKMTGMSSFNDSGDSSVLNDEELLSTINEYSLTLRINYKTEYGQEIAVIGSIPQLGNWDTSRALKMKWTEGHNWVAENIRISESKGDPTYFTYKYALVHQGHHQFYERGFNRIADLKLLKSVENKTADYQLINNEISTCNNQEFVYDTYPSNNDRNNNGRPVKKVQIDDTWEYFEINFQIFNPILNKNELVHINGDHSEIGSWQVHGPQSMSKKKKRSNWLEKEKYGQKVKFNHFPCQIQNKNQGMPIVMRYNYSKKTETGELEWERPPCRVMEIQDPQHYKGQLRVNRKNCWLNCQKVWVVNGQINKVDSNFRVPFKFNQIGNTNVYVGNCPITEDDVIQISRAGIRGVLSLKSQKGDYEQMKNLYKKHGIDCFQNCPIPEFNQIDNLADKLLEAAKVLDSMRKQLNKQKVFVNCTAGMTRSPSLVILYLCLYCQVDFWKSPVDVYQLVKKHHPISYPNMKSIIRIISRNRTLQYHQCLLLQAEYQKLAALEEEKRQRLAEERQNMQARLDQLMDQLAERRNKRKADRRLRLDKRQRETAEVEREEQRIEEERQKLEQIQRMHDQSIEVLNRTNEMLRQNLHDRSNLLIEECDYEPDLKMDTERFRRSVNDPKAQLNITPRLTSRTVYRSKHQNSGKKNKSCTPTKLKSMKNGVPGARLNIQIAQKNQEELNGGGAAGDMSPLISNNQQSQNDNSILRILQKSHMMGSDIGSKELDGIEPPTKSFDEAQNKSDISANNRSIKYRPIITYNNGFISQEHSPIRSRKHQRFSNVGLQNERFPPADAVVNRVEIKNKVQRKSEGEEKPMPYLYNPNFRPPYLNTAAGADRQSQEDLDSRGQQQQDIEVPQEQRSPVFEYDQIENDAASPNIQVDEPPFELHEADLDKPAAQKRSPGQQEYPQPFTMKNSEQRIDIQEERPQNFNQVLHFELQQSDEEDQNKQVKDPETPYLCGKTGKAEKIESSPGKRAAKFLMDTIGALRHSQKKGRRPQTNIKDDEVNPFDINLQSPRETSPASRHRIEEQNTEPVKGLTLTQSDAEYLEPENVNDHIRLIDQIQQRSIMINNQIKEQIKQKKEKRECSVDSHKNLSQHYYQGQEQNNSQIMNQNKQHSSSPSHMNNTSQMENTVVVSEARELLNQNKQDYVALRDSPEQKFIDSFVSQPAEHKDQKFVEQLKLSAKSPKTAQPNMEQESQFKVDTKFPLDDFDSIQKELRLERYLAALGLSKVEILTKCEQIFKSGRPPIPFKCRPNMLIDQMIEKILLKSKSTIPVINVRAATYLIGIYKFSCALRDDEVIIKNQQGREIELKEYLKQNEHFIKQMLVIQTILCKQNLNYVINSHMVDQCIPELQMMESELEAAEGSGRASVKLPANSFRNTLLRPQSDEDSPLVAQRGTPRVKVELQTPDDREIDLNQLQIKKMQTMHNKPHSRNQNESITAFNSSPAQGSPSNREAAEKISVQAYRPKRNAGSYYNTIYTQRKGQHRSRQHDNQTIQSNSSQQKDISTASLAFDQHSSRKSKGYQQTQPDNMVTTTVSQSSKRMSASQIQIQLAREKQSTKHAMKEDLKISESISGTLRGSVQKTEENLDERTGMERLQDMKPLAVDIRNLRKVSPLYKSTKMQNMKKARASIDAATSSNATSKRMQEVRRSQKTPSGYK